MDRVRLLLERPYVGGQVLDLLWREDVLEGRHAAAALANLVADPRGVIDAGDVRAAVAAGPLGAVTGRAVVGEEALADSCVSRPASFALRRVLARTCLRLLLGLLLFAGVRDGGA